MKTANWLLLAGAAIGLVVLVLLARHKQGVLERGLPPRIVCTDRAAALAQAGAGAIRVPGDLAGRQTASPTRDRTPCSPPVGRCGELQARRRIGVPLSTLPEQKTGAPSDTASSDRIKSVGSG